MESTDDKLKCTRHGLQNVVLGKHKSIDTGARTPGYVVSCLSTTYCNLGSDPAGKPHGLDGWLDQGIICVFLSSRPKYRPHTLTIPGQLDPNH